VTDILTAESVQYTRAIRIDQHFYEIAPGDQVDNSTDLDRDWCTVARIGKHDDDRDIEDAPDDRYCTGDCDAVIFFEDDDYAFAFHVRPSDEVFARFPVGGDA
jgi:hypothetical protein